MGKGGPWASWQSLPWGNDFDPTRVNYGKHHDATMPVDSHPEGASYYGAYNMAGNVFEWVSDWYDPHYYGKLQTMVNPTGPDKAVWIGGTGTYVDRLDGGREAGHSWWLLDCAGRHDSLDAPILESSAQ